MKKFSLKATILSLVFLIQIIPLMADGGMWLPLYLKLISGEMNQAGARITADDIYNINKSSIKDAIVQMGGFCTGEIVSDQGLVFTNHHCGYDAIAELSSTSSNLLDDGYWAPHMIEEKPVDGLTMSILVYMKDVTALVNEAKDPDSVIDSIETAASEDGAYETEVTHMYYNTEHYLMVYEVFRDIRFVGAPPSSIGKFGGDTDNWMWPRHTGDFSIFRIYAGPDNKPAEYSNENVPYKPKHHLKISLKGYKQGDFASIMGYPGSTQRYLTAAGAEQITTQTYPDYVKILDERLRIMKEAMDADPAVKLELASDYASLANSYKYFKGVVERSKISDFIEQKKEFEKTFNKWANENETRKEEYGEVVSGIANLIESNKETGKLMNYLNFAGFGPEIVSYGAGFYRLYRSLQADDNVEAQAETLKALKEEADAHFETYNGELDQKMLAAMSRMMYNELGEEQRPDIFESETFLKMKDKSKADRFDNYAAMVFKKSFLASKKKSDKFFKKPSLKAMEKDPGIAYMISQINVYIGNMMTIQMSNTMEETYLGKFITGMREIKKDTKFYPDANSTLRFTFGNVKTYPDDNGKMYEYYTNAQQILMKYIPNDEEFDVPEKLRELIKNKDFGQYAENGEMRVNFLSTTDITGGNSGSPVMDADGNLIGIAFDGNWESMLSDLYFDETVTRTISVDIRYVLFIIDKFGGNERIINELTIVK
jgi:peptidase S46-like protein